MSSFLSWNCLTELYPFAKVPQDNAAYARELHAFVSKHDCILGETALFLALR